MGKNHLKKNILMALMNEGYMATDVIPLLTNDKRYFHMVRHNLVNDGCIVKRKRTVSYQGIKRVVNYIIITPKGVQWLIDNCSDQYPWLRYLPNPVPDFYIQYITNDVQFHRNIKTIAASIVFSIYEIKTYRIEEQINDTKKIPFKTMINGTKKVCGFMRELRMFNSGKKAVNFIAGDIYDNDDAFFYSKDVSKTASLSEKDINQYLFASYIGLLTNRSVHYLIYAAKPQGLLFRYSTVKREQMLASGFLERLHNKSASSEVVLNGIVFCKDKKEFKALFEENQKIYNSGKDKINKQFRSMFNHLYAFIMVRPAISVLGSILCFNGEQAKLLREYLVNANCGFTGNDIYGTDFEYNGTPALIGVDMDLTQIQRLVIEMTSQASRDIRNGIDPSVRGDTQLYAMSIRRSIMRLYYRIWWIIIFSIIS